MDQEAGRTSEWLIPTVFLVFRAFPKTGGPSGMLLKKPVMGRWRAQSK